MKKYITEMTVAKAAALKGVHNPYQLHLKTGISIPRANKLWVGKGKFDLKDIAALCDGLRCGIKDIFNRFPDSSDGEFESEGDSE